MEQGGVKELLLEAWNETLVASLAAEQGSSFAAYTEKMRAILQKALTGLGETIDFE
jgi:hypothetical protein